MDGVTCGEPDRFSATVTQALARWAEADSIRALHPADRDVIEATEAARSLVLDLFGASAPARDLFNACARLGRLMAEGGASPSLAAGVIDTAVKALADVGLAHEPSRIAPARASVIEGYVAAVREREQLTARASWEPPACVVTIEPGVAAVACGYPTDDADALSEWASRVAGQLVRAKIRTVILSGSAAARTEVGAAVDLVGIAVLERRSSVDVSREAKTDPPAREGGRSWFRLPWKK